MDEVWVPTEFHKTIFVNGGVEEDKYELRIGFWFLNLFSHFAFRLDSTAVASMSETQA